MSHVHIPSMWKRCGKTTPVSYVTPPLGIPQTCNITRKRRWKENIFSDIEKKNDDFFASYSHPLPPLAYAFHTWAVRSQTGRDMCTHEYIKRYKGN